eukprot:Nk52_evm1s479 gene=Nk52_evmTU1s479
MKNFIVAKPETSEEVANLNMEMAALREKNKRLDLLARTRKGCATIIKEFPLQDIQNTKEVEDYVRVQRNLTKEIGVLVSEVNGGRGHNVNAAESEMRGRRKKLEKERDDLLPGYLTNLDHYDLWEIYDIYHLSAAIFKETDFADLLRADSFSKVEESHAFTQLKYEGCDNADPYDAKKYEKLTSNTANRSLERRIRLRNEFICKTQNRLHPVTPVKTAYEKRLFKQLASELKTDKEFAQ